MNAVVAWCLASPSFWAIFAAIPAVANEFLYRWLPGPWWKYLYIWTPMQLLISYGVYRLVTMQHTSLIDAFIVWALATTAMRVLVSVAILGDEIKGGTWFALGLLIMAKVAQTFWGR